MSLLLSPICFSCYNTARISFRASHLKFSHLRVSWNYCCTVCSLNNLILGLQKGPESAGTGLCSEQDRIHPALLFSLMTNSLRAGSWENSVHFLFQTLVLPESLWPLSQARSVRVWKGYYSFHQVGTFHLFPSEHGSGV